MSLDASQGKHIGLDPVMGTNPLSALTPNILTPNTPATVSPLILSSVVGAMQMGPCSP